MRRLDRRYYFLILALALGGVLYASPVFAIDWNEAVSQFIGHSVAAIVWLLGNLLLMIINLIVWVAQYNSFISSTAVTEGWKIVRDVCNMFFIIILLLIAFATVLNIEKYSWKHLLPKVLIMAVMINFSKIICGALIDFAQIVMLSFVNGFRDIAGGNFANMAGINDILAINSTDATKDITALSLAGTYILALLYVIVALVVMCVILAVLVIRIVMLWILVVLSPLYFFLQAVPGKGESYAGHWMSQFTSNVVSGPLLAFFIWLSFVATVPGGQANYGFGDRRTNAEENRLNSISGENISQQVGLSQAGTPEGMLKFVVSIGLLIGGLIVSKQLGGAVGGAAAAGFGKIQGGVKSLKKFGANRAQIAGRQAAQMGLRSTGYISQKAGTGLSKVTGGRMGDSLQKSGTFLTSWGGDIRKSRQEEKKKKRKETLEKLGMKEDTMDHLQVAADTRLGRSIKGVTTATVGLAMGNPLLAGMGAAWATYGQVSKKTGEMIKDYAKNKQMDKSMTKAGEDLREARNRAGVPNDDSVQDYATRQFLSGNAQFQQAIINANNETNQHNANEQADRANIQAAFVTATAGLTMGSQAYKEQERQRDAKLDNTKKFYDEERAKTKDKEKQEITRLSQDSSIVPTEVIAALKAERANEDAVNIKQREERTKEMSSNRDNDLKANSRAREAELKQAKSQYGNSIAYDNEAKRINQKYDTYNDRIKNNYKNIEDDIKKDYKDTPDFKYYSSINKKQDEYGTKMKDYRPNKLTIEGAELGAKEIKAAKETVAALAQAHTKDFGKGYWSTPTGINSTQEKLFNALAANTKESKEALLKMVKSLKDMKMNGGAKKEDIEGMMRGFAHYMEKKPESKAVFTEVITALNDGLHPDGKKVDDFKPKKKK